MLLATALTGAAAGIVTARAADNPAPTPAAGSTGAPPQGVPAQTSSVRSEGSSRPADQVESIRVKIQRRLLRERNSPSAVTELGQKQIQQVGVQGSPTSLLRQAPSVNVYQGGIGNNEPVVSIRGLRGIEVASTLDDVPTQDLLQGGTGSYLTNLIGGKFDLSQISQVSIYPGVAYPNRNTFGTIGGTIAYSTLRPSPERGVDVFGSVGSFKTFQEGVSLNTGKLDGFGGQGDNAPSMLFQYTNLQTAGFTDYTPARYNNFEFALDKPYMNGLSKFQATVLYNTGSGYYNNEPIPLPYLRQNGMFSNYPPDEAFARQQDQYLTVILKNDTYINDWLTAGANVFYEYTNSVNDAYLNPNATYASPQFPGALTVGGAPPFVTNINGFGTQGEFGPGGAYYDPAVGSVYNGHAAFPPGSQYCSQAVTNGFAAAGTASPCGYAALRTIVQTDTYGVQPHVTITPPTVWGIRNTIQAGGLIAKETQPILPSYAWGSPDIPQTASNEVAGAFGGSLDGGIQRTIYLAFAQDKVDFLHNTLHITPGLTFEASDSSFTSSSTFGGVPTPQQASNPYCLAGNPCNFGAYQASLWDKDLLPFVNVSYDLDRIAPPLKGVSLYGSYGKSALFAPVNDFTPNTFGLQPPSAALVTMFEGGVKYNTSRLTLQADYFYQKVTRDFGFFQYQSGPEQGLSAYNNLGARLFQGQEFAATWQLTPRWQVFGNFSHLRARYLATDVGSVTIQEDQFGDVIRGTPVTGVPEWLSTFGVDYDHRDWFLGGDDFHARLEGQYTGRQATSYDVTGFQNLGPLPSVPPFGTYGYYNFTSGATTYDPNGGLEPYILFNLDLNYSMPVKTLGISYLKKLDFDLNIINLFDKHYFQYFYRQISPTAPSPSTFQSGPFKGQAVSNYNGAEFADGLPGEPFAVTFTARASF